MANPSYRQSLRRCLLGPPECQSRASTSTCPRPLIQRAAVHKCWSCTTTTNACLLDRSPISCDDRSGTRARERINHAFSDSRWIGRMYVPVSKAMLRRRRQYRPQSLEGTSRTRNCEMHSLVRWTHEPALAACLVHGTIERLDWIAWIGI